MFLFFAQLTKSLREREVLNYQDMVDLLGKPPHNKERFLEREKPTLAKDAAAEAESSTVDSENVAEDTTSTTQSNRQVKDTDVDHEQSSPNRPS